jgi:HAD superfamily hydrolase (TIGR01490 family)
MSVDKKVLIVGAGPVGMLLSIILERAGINVTLVDKRKNISSQSKALTMNSSSLRILHSIGIVDQFLLQGQKINDIYIYWNNHKLMHIDYHRLDDLYSYILALPQSQTEKILDSVISKKNITYIRDMELKNIIQKDEIAIAYFADGSIQKFNYIVGCDGAKSRVRNLIGQDFIGHDYGIKFAIFDAKIDWIENKINKVHYFVKENGFIIVIPLSKGYHRIVIKHEDSSLFKKDLDILQYQMLVDMYAPNNLIIKNIIWQSKADFYNRIVSNLRKERVFLAGDAAHLFSPIGGLGMNTGFQDAFNLGWKLAGVLNKKLNPEILDTYDLERKEIIKLLLQSTDITTKLITRIDKNLEPINNWLPKMSNRDKIKRIYPYAFSGLSQEYSYNLINKKSFKVNIGKYIKYAEFDCLNNRIDTLSLFNGIKGTLIIAKSLKYTDSYIKLFEKFDLDVVVINDQQCQTLSKQGISIRLEEAIFVRPDGCIGWHSFAITSVILEYLESIFNTTENKGIKLALFDVDETLLNINSMLSFLAYFLKKKYGVGDGQNRYNKYIESVNKLSELPREHLNKLYYEKLKGLHYKELLMIGEQWFSENADLIYNRKIIDLLKKHLSDGYKPVIVSGGFFAILDPLSRALNISNILSINPEIDDEGFLTGNILGIQTIGDGKAIATKNKFDANFINWNESYAYGDHISDVSMLKLVGKPRVVGNNSDLLKIASINKWQCL